MIIRSLKPSFQAFWEQRHPTKKIVILREKGMEGNLSLGVRILLLTQGGDFNRKDPEQQKMLEGPFGKRSPATQAGQAYISLSF